MDQVDVIEVAWAERSDECVRIRRLVFVHEQNVPEEIEIDGLDPECRHFLALKDGAAIATARLKTLDHGVKIQRVAVLREARGRGVGRDIMQAMMMAAGPGVIALDAQVSALDFYERLGFVAEGDVFLDANIPHRHMTLLKQSSSGQPVQ